MNQKHLIAFLIFLLTISLTLFTLVRPSYATPDSGKGLSSTIPPAQSAGTLKISHGPISGEISDSSVVLWARGSLTGTFTFDVAEDEEFDQIIASALVEVDGQGGERYVLNLTPQSE